MEDPMGGERSAILLALLMSGCVSEFGDAVRVTESETEALVRAAPFPKQTPQIRALPPSKIESKPDGTRVIRIDLREAIRLAVRNNQRFLAEGENLQVQLLSLEVLRHGWAPSISPISGNIVYTASPDGPHGLGEDATLTLSQKMPFGGSASASWTHAATQAPQPRGYTGTGSISFTQPLLRGGGYGVALEELVSAERGYVYAGRAREFNRVQLHVGVVESYFGLLQREQAIRNFERNLERAKRQALQAQIQESFGRVTRTDVYRSQLQVTRAESDLSVQREQLKIARDAFKIDLGIPPELELLLTEEKFDYRPLALTQDDAVAAALEHNPAWLNARDQVEDARRRLAVAVNATLPRFDVTASYVWASAVAPRWSGPYDPAARDLSVTGGFEIPLDRYSFRRDYQKAVIAERQAERDFLRARDGVVRDVQTQMVLLRQAELAMEFQRRSIRDAEKAARLAEFDYLRGKSANRDVIEAQDQLVQAQNGFEIALVQARISQLRLLNYIGRLAIDADGEWLK
ncbi:MAG: TolC family protein [Planctomycetes bacterium]|nr:TolC family protein [Planctomycetota bacterium]